jgi:hypothetical protein
VLQRDVSGLMRVILRVEITEDPDPNRHAS